MIIFNGVNGKTAKVMIDNIDEATAGQIQSIISHPVLTKSPVIMPDCHKGASCCIGYVCEMEDDIIPNLIGVDIGCSISLSKFNKVNLDFERFDRYVKQNIPMGCSPRQELFFREHKLYEKIHNVAKRINAVNIYDRFIYSIGTLGQGNHFVEIDVDESSMYIVLHSGSRNFGKMVAEFHQKKAVEFCGGASRPKNCNGAGFKLGIPEDQAYIPLEYGGDAYLEDMQVAQEYASLSHEVMSMVLEKYFKDVHGIEKVDAYKSVHNYINFNDNIIRKGAISAHKGERVIIPLSMKDGIILGVGKGNPEWLFSSPHGAGRIMSRSQAKKKITLEAFKESMEGIYSSTVCQSTIDESCFAYKDPQMIIDAIGASVEITKIVKPIYNVKAGGD